MRTRPLALVLVLVLLGLPLLGRAGEVKEAGDLLVRTKVSIPGALDAALVAAPGSAVSVRLIRGDEGPVWRVLVHRGEQLSEVRVDAVSGRASLAGSWRDETDAEKARAPRPGD